MHDCLAGGVVDPGESPEQTATRELAEELGITGVPLTALTSIAWDGQWAGKPMRCHIFAYQIHYDGPIRHQPEEIADGWWWTDAELVAHLADPDWPFVPDTRVLVPALIPALRGGRQ
jgi:8-oxo-dGTP pyrophosphatase MutT (NUDIX family)